MPPVDRHSKAPPVAQPIASFDAPANSRKIARAPWEREDDDAFGPPPALDLSPRDAEAEAKRMVYETTHPLNPALMQNAHFDHNRAMRRYAALARRAWDPAARDIPVQPARTVDEDDLARRATSAPVHGSPLVPPSHSDNPAGSAVILRKKPKQEIGSTTPAATPYRRPLPSDDTLARVETQRQIMRDTIAHIGGDGPLDPQIYADHDEGKAQAWDRGAAARRNDPEAGTPPHAINLGRLADAQAAIDARNDLSDAEKYILLGLIGYEDIDPDIAGSSFGGITEDSFKTLRAIVSALRGLENRSAIEVDSVFELSVDELLDFQRAYLVRYLVPDRETQDSFRTGSADAAQFIHDSDILNRLGPNVIAYQLADSIFNYGSEGRATILQNAVNMTVHAMTPRQRSLGDYQLIKADQVYGEETANAAIALANDPVHQRMFLEYLRLGRARWAWDHSQYRGNNRWRIWGVTPE